MPRAELIEGLARGNVPEVKAVLATVVLALAAYQVMLMAVGYGWVRPRFLDPASASVAHRWIGPPLVLLALVVALICLLEYGIALEDGLTGVLHVAGGIVVFAVLAGKLAILRRFHGASRLLPSLGLAILVLFAVVWATSAPEVIDGS